MKLDTSTFKKHGIRHINFRKSFNLEVELRFVHKSPTLPRDPFTPYTSSVVPTFRFRNSFVAVPSAHDRLSHVSASPLPDEQHVSTAVCQILPKPDLHRLSSHNRPDSYIIEADKWVIFFRPAGSIPERYELFHHVAVEAYLFFRDQTLSLIHI